MAERYETLGVTDWVSTTMQGMGEAILYQDFEHRFSTWRSVRYSFSPAFAASALAHLEAGPFSGPGDAPALVGMAAAGIPAGTQEADYVYNALATTQSRAGPEYDYITDPYEKALAIQRDVWAEKRAAYERGEAATPWPVSWAPGQGPVEADIDDEFTLGGFFKGISRWGLEALQVIPDGLDSLSRAVTQVKAGNLTPGEALGGMFGVDREAGQLVGIPFFQYAADINPFQEGGARRLNMGPGLIAGGEIAPEIQEALAIYDQETNGPIDEVTGEPDTDAARDLYLTERERLGTVTVRGPDGQEHVASNFSDWQWLRNNAGRAALLAEMQYQSPTQEAMGQAHATFSRSVLKQGTIGTVADHPAISEGGNRRIVVGPGAVIAGSFTEPGTAPFHAFSGSLDFGKQLLDLPLVGLGRGISTVVNQSKKYIGSGGLTGDLIRGARTAKDVLARADVGGVDGLLDDLGRGTINRELAANALNRADDAELATATRFLGDADRAARWVTTQRTQAKMRELIETAKRHGLDQETVLERAHLTPWTPNRIQGMLKRAAKGDEKARKWVSDVLIESNLPIADDVAAGAALDNLVSVQARSGVDLFDGRFGTAVVDPDIAAANRAAVDNLGDLLETGKGSFVIDRAKVVADPDNGLILSFDADLGRAQGTLKTLGDNLADRASVARRALKASDELAAAEAREAARQATLARTGVGRGIRGEAPELTRARAAYDEVAAEARAAGLDPTRRGALTWAARWTDPEDARAFVADQLFKADNANMDSWAAKALGDSDDGAREVANLKRVLQRNEAATDLVDHIDSFSHHMPADRIGELLRGGGAMDDMVESIIAAKTDRAIHAIINPTKELMGRTVDPKLIAALKRASTKEEVIQAFMRHGDTSVLAPQRIGLIGPYQRIGTGLTVGGAMAGGTFGAIDQEEGAGFGERLGGFATGAIIGAWGGSAIAGGLGAFGSGLTRNIEDVADLMDATMAGTRATTTSFLRARGVDMGRAQAGLSAPAQLGYGLGHRPWGRRLARSFRTSVDINDPYDLYYTAHDLLRGYGVTSDDVVTRMVRGTGDSKVVTRVVRSTFDDDAAYEAAINAARREGFEVESVFDLDRAMTRIAELEANTPARAWTALRELFDGVDNILVDAGMNPDLANVLTDFARQGYDDFIGNVDAIGHNANYAQGFQVNGEFISLENAPLLTSEQWTGKISLPSTTQVHRAVGQLDTLGKIGNVLTGRNVTSKAWQKLRGLTDEGWGEALSPKKLEDLERNVTMSAARAVTGALWAPMVLLTRPVSFISRVLGEDQARMVAAGLDNVFVHPLNFFTTAISEGSLRRAWNMGRLKGVTARSLIPSSVFDESGRLADDALDQLHHLQLSERVTNGLGIYDTRAARTARNYGRSRWTREIPQGNPSYNRSLAREYRQLLTDPMARRLASSQADDVVDDTMEWLYETSEGQRLLDNWLRQFEGKPEKMAMYADNPDNVRAFLHDEHARLHLKTGGDWVFVINSDRGTAVFGSRGQVIDDFTQLPFDPTQADNGYHIIRGGDPEMLDVVGRGTLTDARGNSINVKGNLTDEVNDQIQEFVTAKRDEFDRTGTHAFPPSVKGTITDDSNLTRTMFGQWDDALDRIYQFWLGQSTNRFSRQPVLGQYYWERVGLMYHSMSDEVAQRMRSLAEAEGRWDDVAKIADAMDDANMPRGIIDDWDMMDLNAKAYAVERTKDLLFDLTRQRNFIDGIRVVMPFAGPLVEALEAWGRVLRTDPVYIWRRGTQLHDALWDTDPLAPEKERFGYFWVNEDGEEMFTFPFTGTIMDWLHDNISEGISQGPISARLRGFNVVFGPEDLSDLEEQEDFAGIPVGALNAGFGPSITVPTAFFMPRGTGVTETIDDAVFPYGRPENPLEAFMPFHMRQWFQGADFMGAQSNRDKMDAAAQQLNIMMSDGTAGMGPEYEYDMSNGAGADAAFAEAHKRATWAQIINGTVRSLLPTMVQPEDYVEIETLAENGVNTDLLLNLSALQQKAYELYTEDGAEILELPDGTRVTTEGDSEIIAAWLNKEYGTALTSSEFLTTNPSNVLYPRQFTEPSRLWMRDRGEDIATALDLDASINLLMPDYATTDMADYDFEARDDAIRRNEIEWADEEEYQREMQGRLLSFAEDQINQRAELLYGPDDVIDDETKEAKDLFLERERAAAAGRYERAVISEGQTQKTLSEILTWNTRDWDSVELTDAERATVDAVLWYLAMEHQITETASLGGVNDITETGSGEEQAWHREARDSLIQLVHAQMQYSADMGHDLGNFPYLWEAYLHPRLVPDEETDALEELAGQMSPWGGVLEQMEATP